MRVAATRNPGVLQPPHEPPLDLLAPALHGAIVPRLGAGRQFGTGRYATSRGGLETFSNFLLKFSAAAGTGLALLLAGTL